MNGVHSQSCPEGFQVIYQLLQLIYVINKLIFIFQNPHVVLF